MYYRLRTFTYTNVILALVIIINSCTSNVEQNKQIIYDIRSAINNESSLELNQEIIDAQYVPLQITDNNESLIDGILDYAVTEKNIYILPSKEARIVLFDKNGNFIKTLIKEGQGPEEFSGLLSGIQADEKGDRLYLYGNMVWEYTLDGTFIKSYQQKAPFIYKRKIEKDRFGAIAMPFVPFSAGSFGIGIFSEEGNLIMNKNDFYSSLISKEKTGLTINMAFSQSNTGNSILFKLGSNDTIFRICKDTIQTACILKLQNSNEEIVRSLDISDFSDMLGERRSNHEIFIQDIFETEKHYYLRCRHNQAFYVISLTKGKNEILVERCEQPGSLKEMGDVTLQHGMLGSKCYQQFPIWGRTQQNELIQVITPAELFLYQEKCHTKIPEALKGIKEDSNPIFIFYKLKN